MFNSAWEQGFLKSFLDMNDAVNEMCTNVLVVLGIILLCVGAVIFIPTGMTLGILLLFWRKVFLIIWRLDV